MWKYIAVGFLLFTGTTLGAAQLDIETEPSLYESRSCGQIHPDTLKPEDDHEKSKSFIGDFPWHVEIVRHPRSFGGSLIHPKVVLTAAHIFEDNWKQSEPITIRAGTFSTRKMSNAVMQERIVTEIIYHKNYTSWDGFKNFHSHDFALLVLSDSLVLADNVNTVCLPDPNAVFEGSRCFLRGEKYGFSEDYYGRVVYQMELPIVDFNVCQKMFRRTKLGKIYNLPKNLICAGDDARKKSCDREGGTPLVCPLSQGQNSRFVQAGSVYWGIGCSHNDFPAEAYGNIASARSWIDEEMKKLGLNISSYIAPVDDEKTSLPSDGKEKISATSTMEDGKKIKVAPVSFGSEDCGKSHPDKVSWDNVRSIDNHLGEFPWSVAIFNGTDAHVDYLCSGSLIHPKIVLTIAHCVERFNKTVGNLKVVVGESTAKIGISPQQFRNLSKILIHEDYYPTYMVYDIALLILSEPVTLADNVNIICISDDEYKLDKRNCIVSGWKKDQGNRDPIWKAVELPVIDRDTCEKKISSADVFGRTSYLPATLTCAQNEFGRDSCSDGLGNPLICPLLNEPSRYVQIGMFSSTMSCIKQELYDMYENTTNARQWIGEQVQEVENGMKD